MRDLLSNQRKKAFLKKRATTILRTREKKQNLTKKDSYGKNKINNLYQHGTDGTLFLKETR